MLSLCAPLVYPFWMDVPWNRGTPLYNQRRPNALTAYTLDYVNPLNSVSPFMEVGDNDAAVDRL